MRTRVKCRTENTETIYSYNLDTNVTWTCERWKYFVILYIYVRCIAMSQIYLYKHCIRSYGRYMVVSNNSRWLSLPQSRIDMYPFENKLRVNNMVWYASSFSFYLYYVKELTNDYSTQVYWFLQVRYLYMSPRQNILVNLWVLIRIRLENWCSGWIS